MGLLYRYIRTFNEIKPVIYCQSDFNNFTSPKYKTIFIKRFTKTSRSARAHIHTYTRRELMDAIDVMGLKKELEDEEGDGEKRGREKVSCPFSFLSGVIDNGCKKLKLYMLLSDLSGVNNIM